MRLLQGWSQIVDTTTSISSIDSRQTPDRKKRFSTGVPLLPQQKDTAEQKGDNGHEVDKPDLTQNDVAELVDVLNSNLDTEKLQFNYPNNSDAVALSVELLDVEAGSVLLKIGIHEALQLANSCTSQEDVLAAVSGKMLSKLV